MNPHWHPFRFLRLAAVVAAVQFANLGHASWHRTVSMSPGMGINDVAADDQRFVAVGRAGLLMTSTDGLNWIDGDAGTYETLLNIETFAGGFLAYGEAGSIFQSTDGLKWKHRLAGAAYSSLTVGNEIALVPVTGNAKAVLRSLDGELWNRVELPFDPGSMHFVSGYFFCESAAHIFWQSSDGLNWEQFNLPGYLATPSAIVLPISNGSAVVTYIRGFGPGVFRSTDAKTWTFVPLDFPISNLFESAGTFYLRSDPFRYFKSVDGVTWSNLAETEVPYSTIPTVQLGTITLRGFSSLARSESGGPFESVLKSIGTHHLNTATPHAIAHQNGHWVTADGNYSPDGISWRPASGVGLFPSDNNNTGERYVSSANQRFFILHRNWFSASGDRLWSSIDGINFTQNAEFSEPVHPLVTFANQTYLIIGVGSRTVYRSSDGATWNKHADALPVENDQNGIEIPVEQIAPVIAAHDDRFLLWITGAGFLSSPDGLKWTALASDLPASTDITEIKSHDGKLVAHDGSRIWESTDGATWVRDENFPLMTINTLEWSGSSLSVIGRNFPPNTLYFAATRNAHGVWTRSIIATDAFPRGIAAGAFRTITVLGSTMWAMNHGEGPQVTARAPRNISILQNQSADVSVVVSSARPLSFQWARGELDIAGATSLKFDTAGFSISSGTRQTLVLKISDGQNATAVPFLITVYPADAPVRSNEKGIRVVTSKNVHGGLSMNLSPAFQGSMLTFQWRKNDTEIQPTYTMWELPINAFTVGDRYQVTATNPAGTATSETITVEWPELTASEIGLGRYPHSSNYFLFHSSIGAWGYQWRYNGIPIPGANESRLSLVNNSPDPLTNSPSGYYDLLIFNDRETIRRGPYPYLRPEDPALATPVPSYPFSPLLPPAISNLSVRAEAGLGDHTLITGFVLSGDAATDNRLSQSFLLRGIGPGLLDHGVTHVLADPSIQLRSATDEILAQNHRWTNFPTDLAPQFAMSGAFPLDSDSFDAALVHTVTAAPGSTSFTVPLVDHQGNESGEALAEIYLLPAGNGSRLSNLSARGSIAPQSPLTAGFVISGTGKLPLFIRAVGPGLDFFEVPGAARAPRLTVFNASGEVIATSPSGYNGPFLSIESAVGAFPLPPGSANAATYLDLPAGAYTAQVEDDTGGIVLLELYLLQTPILVIEIPPDVVPL